MEFKKALTRIFRIVDKDCDNFITDDELNSLQLEVFKGELTQEDIKGIKDVIKDDVKLIKSIVLWLSMFTVIYYLERKH